MYFYVILKKMFLNNVHKGVVITYEKAITISVITIIGLLLAVLIFLSIRSSRLVYNNDNAIGNSVTSITGFVLRVQ